MDIPLHPALVHYPIAFLLGALLLHGLQLWRPYWMCRVIGLWLLALAAIFSIFASQSGEKEMARAGQMGYPSEVLILMNRHELLGNLVTWGSIILLVAWIFLFFKNMRDKRVDVLAFAFLFLLTAMVLITSNIGGQLVWIHKVGIP